MKWINNLRLTPRLMLAFGVVMALTLVLGLVSYNAIRDLDRDAQYLAKEKMVGLEKAVRLADLASRHRIQTFTLIVPSSAAAKDAARQRQAELAAAFDAAWTIYSQTQPEAGEDELRSKTQEQWAAFTGKAKEIDELVTMEFAEDATDMAIGEGDAMYKELAASLDGLAALKVKAAQEAADRAASTYSAAKGTIFTVLAIAFIASILFAYLVGSSVVGGVASALKLVNEIAGGKLDGRVDLSRKDEIGALNAGMAKMQNTLQSFMTAEIEMAKAHEAGQLDHRIPADQFTGAYADMARSLNELVSEQISTMSRAIALMRRYAIGDLSEDMAALPGQKAEITDTMAQTKHNLQAVNAEIQRLVRAAADGDFTIRGDESQYQFAFQEMVAGLNQLMQNADAGLGDVGRLLSALSQGDLTLRVDNRYKGAFFSLVDNANTTVERLTGIARKIMESSEAINVAASEIASGNSDLSNRTEQQAANLEETASSMEELTSTVKQNAENSRQARQLAVGAADVAAKGGEVVGKVVTTMDAISASSKRIEDIISVIDGIAFQTNILALNAAVEAARAGEQGRGFAVVASEVRSLAQRSADAAKEIKELIAESVITVESGSQLVHQAGKTMDEIVSSVRRVTDIMSEIAAASDEQSSGIGQVNETIVQMDETTQQNAALVEQASAAARSMEEQANQLSAAVSVFRLPGGAEVSKPKPKEREVISGPGLLASRTQPAASRPAPARASAAVTSKPVVKTASSRPEPTPAGKPAEASGPAAGKPAPRPASAPVAPARPAPSKPAPTKSGASKIDDSHWEEF